MPGEPLPLWGSPPQLWPGHHVQLPRRPGLGRGRMEQLLASPPLWRPPVPPNPCRLEAFPGERSPREKLDMTRLVPRSDCPPLARFAPFSGFQTRACFDSLLSNNWLCKRPSLYLAVTSLTSASVRRLWRKAAGAWEICLGDGLTQSWRGLRIGSLLGFLPCVHLDTNLHGNNSLLGLEAPGIIQSVYPRCRGAG